MKNGVMMHTLNGFYSRLMANIGNFLKEDASILSESE